MRRIHELILRACLITLGRTGRAAEAKADLPNIIFIHADDIELPGFGSTGGICIGRK